MTPSFLLTAFPPTSDADSPLSADYPKRNVVLPPFGIIAAHPARSPIGPSCTPTPTRESECDVYDTSRTDRILARQWTGAPIRAIVPLPQRRKHGLNGAQDATRSVHNAPAGTVPGPPPCLTRSAHSWDDADADCGGEGEGSETSRCCSYESITAAEGLSAWSFEELRVECYAQSLVARGTKPPPAVQPSLAIPPAFVPRFVLRS